LRVPWPRVGEAGAVKKCLLGLGWGATELGERRGVSKALTLVHVVPVHQQLCGKDHKREGGGKEKRELG